MSAGAGSLGTPHASNSSTTSAHAAVKSRRSVLRTAVLMVLGVLGVASLVQVHQWHDGMLTWVEERVHIGGAHHTQSSMPDALTVPHSAQTANHEPPHGPGGMPVQLTMQSNTSTADTSTGSPPEGLGSTSSVAGSNKQPLPTAVLQQASVHPNTDQHVTVSGTNVTNSSTPTTVAKQQQSQVLPVRRPLPAPAQQRAEPAVVMAVQPTLPPPHTAQSPMPHVSPAIVTSAAFAAAANLEAHPAHICVPQHSAIYPGERLLMPGMFNFKSSWELCCEDCLVRPSCNVWVWCGRKEGCGDGRQYKECWLREASMSGLAPYFGKEVPGTHFTSGALLGDRELQGIRLTQPNREAWLQQDANIPLAYMDLSRHGTSLGRLVIALFSLAMPLAAENFRHLCIGGLYDLSRGLLNATTAPRLAGQPVTRIKAGDVLDTGHPLHSAYGAPFLDDLNGLTMQHDRPGMLSTLGNGRDHNSGRFQISLGPAHHRDRYHVIFGQVVAGLEVLQALNALAQSKPNHVAETADGVTVAACGMLRDPTVGLRAVMQVGGGLD